MKIARALTEISEARIRNVYYKSETTLPYKAQLDPQNDYLIGKFDGNIAVENGLRFNIDWLRGRRRDFSLTNVKTARSLRNSRRDGPCSTCFAIREVFLSMP